MGGAGVGGRGRRSPQPAPRAARSASPRELVQSGGGRGRRGQRPEIASAGAASGARQEPSRARALRLEVRAWLPDCPSLLGLVGRAAGCAGCPRWQPDWAQRAAPGRSTSELVQSGGEARAGSRGTGSRGQPAQRAAPGRSTSELVQSGLGSGHGHGGGSGAQPAQRAAPGRSTSELVQSGGGRGRRGQRPEIAPAGAASGARNEPSRARALRLEVRAGYPDCPSLLGLVGRAAGCAGCPGWRPDSAQRAAPGRSTSELVQSGLGSGHGHGGGSCAQPAQRAAPGRSTSELVQSGLGSGHGHGGGSCAQPAQRAAPGRSTRGGVLWRGRGGSADLGGGGADGGGLGRR